MTGLMCTGALHHRHASSERHFPLRGRRTEAPRATGGRPTPPWTGALLAVALGCSGLGRPAVRAESPTVEGVSGSGLQLGVRLLVDNPNSFPLVAEGLRGSLSLGPGDGQRVGTAEAKLDEPIPAKGSAAVQSELEIAWSSVSALRNFLDQSEVPFTFDGELRIGSRLVKTTLPFQVRGRLTRAQLVKAARAGATTLDGLLP